MKIRKGKDELEFNWMEVAAFIVIIYLLITGNLHLLVELIGSLI